MKTQSARRRVYKRVARRGKGTNNNTNNKSALISSSSPDSLTTLVKEPLMPVFPARIYKRLRYSTNATIGAAAGAVNTYVFRANDLFDPDLTGTGHQPMGFDQLMLWYNHFVVAKAKITCTFSNLAAARATVCIRQDGDLTPITVIDRILEIGGLVKADLENKGVSGSMRTLEIAVDIARLQGVSPIALSSDPSLQGSAAASPAECTYFHVACWDSGAGGTTSVLVDVLLEQEAYFCEPRNLIES